MMSGEDHIQDHQPRPSQPESGTSPVIQSATSVYYFATCLIDLFYPHAGLAGLELLEQVGVRVVVPSGQTCCAQPAWNAGYAEEARSVARAQLALFEQPWPIVVPSASCAGMFRHHYPQLFEAQPEATAACRVAERVFELSEFLVHRGIQLKDLGEPVSLVVHHSCSAQRAMRVAPCLDTLLAQLSGVQHNPIQRATECCGFGGTFAIKEAALSAAMASDKCDALEASSATLFLCADAGCLMNLSGMLAKRGSKLRAQHLYEFLLERIRP